jgi:hypothetical protein
MNDFGEAGRGSAYKQYGTAKQKQAVALAGQERMRYPLTDQETYQGRVIFTARKNEEQNIFNKTLDALIGAYVDQTVSSNLGSDNQIIQQAARKSAREALVAKDKGTYKSKLPLRIGSGRKCTLYLPMSMGFQDRVTYNNVDLGILGAGTEAALQSGADLFPALGTAFRNAFANIGDTINYGLGSPGAQVAAMRIASKLNTGVAGAISSTTGIALNPNKRAILAGPEIRTFRFTFKMIPDSHEEAEEVKRIVRFFREEMYPESQREAGIQAAFRYPSIFDIQMKYRNKDVATYIKPSYLTDVAVQYNQSSMAFHSDGNFQETDITLTFTETVALTAQDITEGY